MRRESKAEFRRSGTTTRRSSLSGVGDEEKRCVILARVSKPDQAEEEHKSLDAQLRLARERAAREGWVIVREYVAPGESA